MYVQRGIYYSAMRRRSTDMGYHLDEARRHVQGKKPGIKGQVCDSTYTSYKDESNSRDRSRTVPPGPGVLGNGKPLPSRHLVWVWEDNKLRKWVVVAAVQQCECS